MNRSPFLTRSVASSRQLLGDHNPGRSLTDQILLRGDAKIMRSNCSNCHRTRRTVQGTQILTPKLGAIDAKQ
ncbi:hypothetical protein Fuma_03285 [Fuerstiella marisgermanici]|uniref:Cytochrome c domain-containing protein n=1 Tax=Fuerstiella marisgermanici TaxID=1891926 RepID=A0A1P8WI05_9PLAN|nr:hypothetical protein Fuma_03285 [Fuerstiella marisgermanici]